ASSVLTAEQCAILETVVEGLMGRHGGDVRRCLNALSGFGRLRQELERRHVNPDYARASSKLSTNPTVSSLPINGGHKAPDPGSGLGPGPGPAVDDSLFRVGDDVSAGEAHVEPPDEWFLGTPSAAGMRFQILRPHAQGGIGKVSVAFDAELQREVALKQIKPERADDTDSRARFLLEAEVTGRLEHPGIVPVYGLGIDDDGRPFYAMRFVRGTSFEEAIAQFHRGDADPSRDPRERMLA